MPIEKKNTHTDSNWFKGTLLIVVTAKTDSSMMADLNQGKEMKALKNLVHIHNFHFEWNNIENEIGELK